MNWAIWCKAALEYLGGARDDAPGGPVPTLGSPVWGLWWAILTMMILLFSGQSSKFIYIDF